MLTVVLLDNHENFIKFLDPNLISIEETNEQNVLRNVSVQYWVEDFNQAKNDFKLGNKLWISGDKNLTDCLYVINTTLERDYYKENNITFECEDVLVELNYAPLFSQTDINSDDFNVNNTGVVTLDRSALGEWFGDYFNIGIVQEVLHSNLKKILPKGTLTLMELLRFIEDETDNVFITRYMKDVNSNIIHRYLDFLNPNDADKTWELVFDYDFPIIDNTTFNLPDSEDLQDETIIDDEDEVTFENETSKEVTPADLLKLRIIKNDNVLSFINENNETCLFDFTAEELGLTGEHEEYEITIKSYNENNTHKVDVIVLGESYNADDDDVISNEVTNTVNIELPNDIEVQLYNSNTDEVLFNFKINTILGKIHEDILDLGYNTENIVHEIDETDTFNAIAPLLSNDNLNYAQMNTLIQNWINLEIEKGSLIPMIVQKVTDSNKNRVQSSDPKTNYWSRPIKPSDNIDTTNSANSTYEYWRGTAYWKAPFKKEAGEIFVADNEDTGIEYSEIFQRKDLKKEHDLDNSGLPKIGTVETSEENPYAIFNDVCMKLKEKRYPELNLEVDIANYRNNDNTYELYDKVYVKIPTFDNLVIASVSKTVKNAHNIGTNSIELSNYRINTKLEQIETELLADEVKFNYPQSKNFTVTLQDIDENKLSNQYISIELLKVENESASATGTVYSHKTNANGQVTINLKYDPGTYQLNINYGGDTGYESSNLIVPITVGGKKVVPIAYLTAKANQKVIKKTLYWNKYGASPKGDNIISRNTVELLGKQSSTGNFIMAIGKAVTKADKKVYGNHLIQTVFEKKCKRCGSNKLFWGYKWAGKKDKGTFNATRTVEPGAITGRIICKKCGTSYDVLGQAGIKKLKVVQSTKVTNSTTLNKLKSGKLKFGVRQVIVSTKKAKNTGTVMSRSSTPPKSVSGVVAKKVKNQAKNIVGGKTGVNAAKSIAKWIAKNIKNEDRIGFYQSPAKTLNRHKGNGYCKTDLFLHMCDAVGIVNDNISMYYVFTQKKKSKTKKKTKRKTKTKKKITKHMLARVNGHWVDVTLKNPWDHRRTGFGAMKNYKIYRYPYLPVNRTY